MCNKSSFHGLNPRNKTTLLRRDNFCENFYNIRDIALVNILYMVLHKEIGLKSAKVLGDEDLGIKAILVQLKFLSMKLCFLDSSIARRRSKEIKSQHFWKKPAVKPSGPGALSEDIENTTSFISTRVKGLIRKELSCEVIKEGIVESISSVRAWDGWSFGVGASMFLKNLTPSFWMLVALDKISLDLIFSSQS